MSVNWRASDNFFDPRPRRIPHIYLNSPLDTDQYILIGAWSALSSREDQPQPPTSISITTLPLVNTSFHLEKTLYAILENNSFILFAWPGRRLRGGFSPEATSRPCTWTRMNLIGCSYAITRVESWRGQVCRNRRAKSTQVKLTWHRLHRSPR